VLENLENFSEEILQKREILIQTNKTMGNNKALNEYKQLVPSQLSQLALSWCIGLVLSDATLQRNYSQNNRTIRVKIQQVSYNIELLEVTMEILKPYVFSFSPITTRPDMYSLTTITHESFNILGEIFQNPNIPLGQQACVAKRIPENIGDYVDEIVLSSWFCGDGGRVDYTENQGKAVQFSTHGFTRECQERLAQALRTKYGWEVSVVFDYTNEKGQDFFCIQVAANSFNSIERILKPYILPTFVRKFPTPRSPRSRYLDS